MSCSDVVSLNLVVVLVVLGVTLTSFCSLMQWHFGERNKMTYNGTTITHSVQYSLTQSECPKFRVRMPKIKFNLFSRAILEKVNEMLTFEKYKVGYIYRAGITAW